MKLSRKIKRGAGAAILAAVLGLPVQPECHGAKMIIIWCFQAFEPVGQLNQPGTAATLTFVSEPRELEPIESDLSRTVLIKITASQAHTGASAVEERRFALRPGHSSGATPTFKLHAAPGSPRFEPGPVEASAEVTFFTEDGQVFRTSSWSRTVELVQH